MRIQVLYFAFFRERLGRESQNINVPKGSCVGDLLARLAEEHEAIAAMKGRYRAAVNQEMVANDHELGEGDEIALIPPVAGGCDQPSHRYAKICDRRLSVDRTVAAVDGRDVGAIVTFIGQVRDRNDGHDVVGLEYEAYKDMAERVMAKLCATIEGEVSGARLAVEHRVGALDIGDAAVVIAAAAPHRAEAFRACRLLIDRLKEQVPIWKKEVAPDGEEWIGMGP